MCMHGNHGQCEMFSQKNKTSPPSFVKFRQLQKEMTLQIIGDSNSNLFFATKYFISFSFVTETNLKIFFIDIYLHIGSELLKTISLSK